MKKRSDIIFTVTNGKCKDIKMLNKEKQRKQQKIVNTNGLEEGSIFKSYKALCEFLKIDVKTGGAKKNQMANWERYFSWDKKGNSFIITKIKDTPDSFIDKRALRTTDLCGLSQLLLVEYLFSKKECFNNYDESVKWWHMSKKEFYNAMGLVTSKWDSKFKKESLKKLNQDCKEQLALVYDSFTYDVMCTNQGKYEQAEIEEIVSYIYRKLYGVFYSAIRSMNNHKILNMEFTDETYYEVKDLCNNKKYRITTEIENKQLKAISDKILDTMVVKNQIEEADIFKIFDTHAFLLYYSNFKTACKATYGLEIIASVNKILAPMQYDSSTIFSDLSRFTSYSLADNIKLMNKLFYDRLITGLPKAKMNKDYKENKNMMDFAIAKQKILIDYFVSLKDDNRVLSWWQGKKNIFADASLDIFSNNYKYQYDKIQNQNLFSNTLAKSIDKVICK